MISTENIKENKENDGRYICNDYIFAFRRIKCAGNGILAIKYKDGIMMCCDTQSIFYLFS